LQLRNEPIKEPTVQISGIYKVYVTDELVEQALQLKYGGAKLTKRQLKEAKDAVLDELSSVILIDVLVSNPYKTWETLDDLAQIKGLR
jgi:hypothetical protein